MNTAQTSPMNSLNEFKSTASKRLTSVGFPTDSNHLWKYTKPEQFKWELLKSENSVDISLQAGKSNLVLEDNIPSSVLECISTGDLLDDGISLFHASNIQKSAYLRVPKGVNVADPVTIKHAWNSSGASLVVVHLEENSSLTLVEELTHEKSGFIAPRFEFLVGKNASLNFASMQLLGGNVNYFGKHRAFLGRDSKAYMLGVSFGAQVARTEFDLVMQEQNSEGFIRGLYIADGSRHVDFHTNQIHIAPHCRSDLLCKGILRDESRAVYYGFIKVNEDAQKTDAYQTSRNLILSPNARADSIPNLEIKANDVKCSHGASVGQVNPQEKFYLMTRGLTEDQAELLLIEGFLNEVLEHFPVPSIVENWGVLLSKRLIGK